MKKQNYNNPLQKSITVHDLPADERPREKLRREGAEKLSNPELLAIILRSGTKGESVLMTAQRIMAKYTSLEKIAESSFDDLLTFKGLGPAKSAQLQACFEISKRINKGTTAEQKNKLGNDPVTNPNYAVDLIRGKISNYSKENFIVLSFDTRNRLIGTDNISIGNLTASIVHPRETYEAAIRRHAAQIIIAHNHPSGDAEPSDEDIRITKRLSEAGKVMGIELIDHIIVTETNYFSFKEKNMV
jgi:DNA repair protein RadC